MLIPAIARTQKQAKNFFQFFMRFFNNRPLYTEERDRGVKAISSYH